MAPVRKKFINTKLIQDFNKLELSDVLCPICRSILIEPVTLPCGHGFCLYCFNGSVANNALTCPICRTRIGSWLRSATRATKIVNINLWEHIKKTFNKEIEAKSRGEETDVADLEPPRKITICNQGEIRREYEKELETHDRLDQKEKEKEAKATEAYIRKLQQREAKERQRTLEQVKCDEELARRLSLPKPQQISVNKHMIASANIETKNCDSELHMCKSANCDSNTSCEKLPKPNHVIQCPKVDSYLSLPGPSSQVLPLYQNKISQCASKTNIIQRMAYHKPSLGNLVNTHDSCVQVGKPVNTDVQKSKYGCVVRTLTLLKQGIFNVLQKNVQVAVSGAKEATSLLRKDGQGFGPNGVPPSLVYSMLEGLTAGRTSSGVSSVGDSIDLELSHFKPVRSLNRTPFKRLSNGTIKEPVVVKCEPVRTPRKININLETEVNPLIPHGPVKLKSNLQQKSAFASAIQIPYVVHSLIGDNDECIVVNKSTSSPLLKTYKKKNGKRDLENISNVSNDDIAEKKPKLECDSDDVIDRKNCNNPSTSNFVKNSFLSPSKNNLTNLKQTPKETNGFYNNNNGHKSEPLVDDEKITQEKDDFEYAKRLQEELKSVYKRSITKINNNTNQHNNNVRGKSKLKTVTGITEMRSAPQRRQTAPDNIVRTPRKRQTTLDNIVRTTNMNLETEVIPCRPGKLKSNLQQKSAFGSAIQIPNVVHSLIGDNDKCIVNKSTKKTLLKTHKKNNGKHELDIISNVRNNDTPDKRPKLECNSDDVIARNNFNDASTSNFVEDSFLLPSDNNLKNLKQTLKEKNEFNDADHKSELTQPDDEKITQEKDDFEYAKRLQEEFKSVYNRKKINNTNQHNINARGKCKKKNVAIVSQMRTSPRKRQTTLDNIVRTPRKEQTTPGNIVRAPK